MLLKSLLFSSTLLLAMPVTASSSSEAAVEPWSTNRLNAALASMPNGNESRGESLHREKFCASCHGSVGEAPTLNWPSLAGQRREYTYKILLDYKKGRRSEDVRSEVMVLAAQHLSDQDMADLAAFYAAQPLPEAMAKSTEWAATLVEDGDASRLITPCASCHGLDGQGGKNESPAIAGQSRQYFVRTMRLYHSGGRSNDNEYAMRAFAMPLTDQEILELADYFAPVVR
jgi:cytochrome c553